MEGGKRLRRLLVARRDLVAKLFEALAHGRICEALHHRGVELGDDIGRRALRRPYAVPERKVQPRHAGLVDGRHVGGSKPALLRQHGVGLDAAGAILRQRLARLRTGEIDLPRQHVLHHGQGPAIRHQRKRRPGHVLKIDEAHVDAAAEPGGSSRGLAGISFQPGDQLMQIARRQVLAPDDPERRERKHRDRLEVVEIIERDLIHRAGADVRGPLSDHQRVAVGRRAIETGHADGPAGTTHILDHHRLAERGLHALGDDARDDIGHAAGRERHDHSDRPRRKSFCCGAGDAGQHRQRNNERSHPSPRLFWLVRVDVSRLDDRPPLVELGLVEAAQPLRRLLVGRRDHVTELGQALAHRWVRKRLLHRRIEPGNDLRRRALGHPQAVPERDVHAGRAHLVHRRHVGSGRPAFLRHHGVGPDRAAAQERQGLRCFRAEHVDLSRHQVLHDWRAPAVRHEREARSGLLLKVEQADMRPAASPDRRGRRLARVGLEPGDQFLGILRRERVPADDHQGRGAQEGDGLKLQHRIVGDRIHGAGADMARPVADAERIAVGRGLRGAADADAGAGTGDILDHHRLPEGCPHALGQDARQRVVGAARRERHDHGDGVRRISLAPRGRTPSQGHNRSDRQRRQLHAFPPDIFVRDIFVRDDDTQRVGPKSQQCCRSGGSARQPAGTAVATHRCRMSRNGDGP